MLRAYHPETVASVVPILMSTIRSFRKLSTEAAELSHKKSYLDRLSRGRCGI